MRVTKRDNERIRETMIELSSLLPDGKFNMSWEAWGANWGWRLTVTLPPAVEAQLDAAVVKAHALHPFTIKREWVRWPTGLSLAGGSDLRQFLTDAVETARRMRGYLCCQNCGQLLSADPVAAAR